jgi:nucleotide-binding universal stress UspA family protein
MKILLAADGSPYTRNAALHVAHHLEWFAKRPEVHVVHIRPPIPYASAEAAVGRAAIDKYEREESEVALAVAEKELIAAKIPYTSAWRVGDVATELAGYVKKHGIDLVVMGSHGQGALANLALGSVATKCIATIDVPIMIVRRAPQDAAARASAKGDIAAARPTETGTPG